MPKKQISIKTIGHSTRALDLFIRLLKAHSVERVIDVRTIPRSRKNPQFNRETLADELAREGISYEHMPGLGGLRHAKKDSVNTAWENASFRGFADYMETDEFEYNLDTLMEKASGGKIAIMCAEALPWRCHRSLIADALTVRGAEVFHIMGLSREDAHRLTPWARVRGKKVFYPAGEAD